MTTAEQIIAEHAVSRYRECGNVVCWCGARFPGVRSHAAHVVAALTNAGKTIAEAGPLYDMVAQLAALETWARARVEDWGDQTAQKVLNLISTETPRAAAARVAEGGDQP
ncbi:hypothetical protein GS507_05285 [Rhodococcus hoagii]|nr:hypothetical protein [Prescottella equi]